MITEIFGLALLVIFTVLAIWLTISKMGKGAAILFMLAGGLSMMMGLAAPDTLSSNTSTTSSDITVGLALIAFSLLSIAFAYGTLFWSGEEEDEE